MSDLALNQLASGSHGLSCGSKVATWASSRGTRCYSLLGIKTASMFTDRSGPAASVRSLLASGVQCAQSGLTHGRRAKLSTVQAQVLAESQSEATAISEYLLHRVSRGDAEAVRECIARFGGLIWTLARRVGLPENESEDAVHEIFTELWKHGHKYDASIASETAFVATIARRRLIDRRRRVARQPIKQQIFEESAAASGGDSSDRTFVAEEAQRAEQALTQLTNEQQRVLRLSVYEGLSHELIARSTGMPLGTVKTHARRGLIKLREMLGITQAGPEVGESATGGSTQATSTGTSTSNGSTGNRGSTPASGMSNGGVA